MLRIAILSVIFTMNNLVFAQDFKQTYVDANKTWLGIDFTIVKFVNSEAFAEPDKLNAFAGIWNDFVNKEPNKYDLPSAFFDGDIKINLDQVNKRNNTIKGANQVQEENHTVSPEEAEKVALSYNLSNIDGIAIILVAECYNKPNLSGRYWLIMVDAKTKTTILSQKYSGKPGGFGFKNYWARSFYNTLNQIEKDLKTALK